MFVTKLKTQLLLITIVPLLLTIVVVTFFILFEVLDSIETEVMKRGTNIASQASIMSEFPFYTGDLDALENVADLMMRTHNLAYIRFIDSTGQMLIHKKAFEQISGLREFSVTVHAETPNLDDFSANEVTKRSEKALGTIEIGLNNQGADAQRFQAYIKVLGIAIVALLIGSLFVLVFSRKLTNAISSLINTAHRLEQRDFSARSQENGSGELLNFQTTFNKMVDSLQQNDADLQKKISEATASLNYTVSQLSEKNKALAEQRQETINLERSKAILEERERIMRDMHDGIGGQLVASLALLEKEEDSEIKHDIFGVLTDCLNDLRLIIHSLSMQNSVLSSLLADFKYRTSRKLEQLGIELDWHVNDEAESFNIKPQTGLHLLRILQEAFTNILKHANADSIQFIAEPVKDGFQIIIQDNGRFDMNNTNEQGHGISNMKTRAQKIGGSLFIENPSSGGCRVILNIPI
ncbi:ATP-binding protein [Methylophaga sp.]|uniref:sensor histidine kinase n=1 Tax=Methylophaga sp. TaxID=2024840 RepID=UPI003F69EA06